MSDDGLKVARATVGRMSREDRRLARRVTRDAAYSMGIRRLAFMRRVAQDDPDALEELKISLASCDDAAEWEFDPDKFQAFLNMIIEFIRALLSILMPFL